MRPASLTAILACAALAACGSVRKPDLRLPAAYEAPAGAPAGSVALDHWWTVFGDAQLDGLIDSALTRNPDARSAAARLAEARASRASALAQFLPKGAATGQALRTHSTQLTGPDVNIPGYSTSGVSEAYAANFDVSWEVDVFGRVFAAGRAANAAVAAAGFDYQATRASLAAQTADAYFQARGLAIQLADARETARIEGELYNVASKRAELGLAASSDADRIAGDLSQAQAQVAALEAQLQAEKRAVLILAGRVVEPTANLDAPPNVGAVPPVPAAIPSQLLARRPDVREAQANLRYALGLRDAAALALLPTFNFTPGVGWTKQTQPGFNISSWSWTLGGTFSQPVLDIPRLLADLHVQNARAEQSVAAYEKTVQTAFSEAESSLVNLDADRRRIALLTEGERRAARAYQAARIGYDRGITDLQTTLSVEQAWRTTRTQLTAAQVEGLRRAVQAYKALGGGWPYDTTLAQAQAR